MPDKVIMMFQPDPIAPQIAPDGFTFEAAPSSGGPWIPQSVTLQKLWSTIDCELLTLNLDGTAKYPGVNFTMGDCYRGFTTVTPTDTHLRARAYALVDNTEVTVMSNVIPLPEPHVGAWFFLMVLAWVALIGYEGTPD
jgi:hypothetical protein